MLMSRRCLERKLVVMSAVVVGVASLAGCASDREQRREAYAHEAYAMRAAALPKRASEPELEDDGLPSQAPPPANRRLEPDDPREPFSPNYGKPAYGKTAAVTVPAEPAYPTRRIAAN